VVIGMWLERFLIIVPSLSHKYLPYSWATNFYKPSWVEITITAATFAAMVMLYMLFSKFIPIISVWELKWGQLTEEVRDPVLARADEEEATA
jgi:Ni/Fe-hydrogenase subunit HybB-like protein